MKNVQETSAHADLRHHRIFKGSHYLDNVGHPVNKEKSNHYTISTETI